MGFPENILSSGDCNIELETNTVKKRVGFYIHKNVSYVRRFDLEKENLHIVIIDVKSDLTLRLITLYRSFRPQGVISPEAFFNAQLILLKTLKLGFCFFLI